jgi:ABC-type nitrate/sulfonate/bicarbonate transport system permease component
MIRREYRGFFLGPITVGLILTLWQLLPSTGLVDPHMVPTALATMTRFAVLWLQPTFYQDLGSTLWRLAAGMFLGAVIGILCGLWLGRSRNGLRAFRLTIDILRPVPTTALVPVAALLLGLGHKMHIFVVAFAAVMPMLLATLDGVSQIDPILIATARTLRQTPARVFRTVLLPACLPGIITGLRVALGIALVVEVSSEMMMSTDGLGQRLVHDQRLLHVSDVYAEIIVIALLGFVSNRLILTAEAVFVGWKRVEKT